MALVILPCDLPHWYSLQKQLTLLSTVTTAQQLTEGMLKIHNMCNTSTGLDPDEPEKSDPTLFAELERFLTDLPAEEQTHFFNKILPAMTKRALDLKLLKPGNGFHFSLQQQADQMVYKRSFLASLLSHSFFSTFPKRTPKTHPTLQDFNFTFFFKHLDQPSQQAKLKSFLHYFDILEEITDEDDCITFSRQVMSGKQWLTIEDWVDSCLPLCPITVRHDGALDEAEPQCLRICFSSSKIGGQVLQEGTTQESIEFCTVPELICILASVEALEDNETLLIKDAYQISKISTPRQAGTLEKYEKPVKVYVCCMDAENYTRLPLSQLEEDNVLRELNKALLGFRQGKAPPQKPPAKSNVKVAIQRRLSPIGESFSSTAPEQATADESPPTSPNNKIDSPTRRAAWLRPPSPTKQAENQARRGKFIVLGSSGECLPVNRTQMFFAGKREVLLSQEIPLPEKRLSNKDSLYSSAQSDDEDDDEVFHSARTSIDFDRDDYNKESSRSDEGYPKPNTIDMSSLSTEEKRFSFAERLREALLRGATTYSTSSDDSSYAVGISVTGSSTADQNNIRCKRGTSTGFLLQEESLDDGFYQESTEQDRKLQNNQSDKYSFTTDSSDFEEMYTQFSKWINSASKDTTEIKREEAITEFATTILKRAFSDTYAVKGENEEEEDVKKKMVLTARSLSLELAKQNPKLAAQLVSILSDKDNILKSLLPNKDGQRPVASGNWGCGSCQGGDAQIKLTIQWLAASHTGLPNLIYYTCRHHKLVKLDTVRRVLIDRGWTVGQLTTSLLQYAQMSLHDSQSTTTLFDLLITSVHS